MAEDSAMLIIITAVVSITITVTVLNRMVNPVTGLKMVTGPDAVLLKRIITILLRPDVANVIARPAIMAFGEEIIMIMGVIIIQKIPVV